MNLVATFGVDTIENEPRKVGIFEIVENRQNDSDHFSDRSDNLRSHDEFQGRIAFR